MDGRKVRRRPANVDKGDEVLDVVDSAAGATLARFIAVVALLAFIAGCQSKQPVAPLSLRTGSQAQAALDLTQNLCIAHLGKSAPIAAIATIAEASRWPSHRLIGVPGYEERGVTSRFRGIWSVKTSGGPVVVATGKLGGSGNIWFCRVIWTGRADQTLTDEIPDLRVFGIALGEAKLVQENVPWVGAVNHFFPVSATTEKSAAINYSRPASAHSSGIVLIDVTAKQQQ
jgi:hypothetical protein